MNISMKGISRFWTTQRYRRKLAAEPVAPGTADGAIVLFAPEGGVRSHHATMRRLGRLLADAGNPVLVTRCFGCFSMCSPLSMFHVQSSSDGAGAEEICERCAISAWARCDDDGLASVDLRSLLDAETQTIVTSAAAAMASRPQDFEHDGIPFGRLCGVDFALLTKQSNTEDLSPDHLAVWQKLVETGLIAYLLSDRLCRRYRPRAIVYHNDYAMNLAVRLAAERHGVNVTGVTMAYHCNIDRNRILFFPKCFANFAIDITNDWPNWRDRPLPPARVTATMDDVIYRIGGRGSHIYSPPIASSETLRRDMGIVPGRKLVVAFTSSLDEMIGARATMDAMGDVAPTPQQPFVDQIDWLGALVAWAGAREDVQLVVRVHPREGKNHRESVVSDHLGRLMTAFADLPDNCTFVWPGDAVSSYGLGEIADVALISWSTIGIEMARLGVPVLTAFDVPEAPYPKNDFIAFESTRDRYFAMIDTLLDSAPKPESMVRVFRWYTLFNLETALETQTNEDRFFDAIWTRDPDSDEKTVVERLILGNESIIDLRTRNAAPGTIDDAEAENDALKAQIARLIRFVMTGQDLPNPVELSVLNLETDGTGTVTCRIDGQSHTRYSPMVERLWRIAGQL